MRAEVGFIGAGSAARAPAELLVGLEQTDWYALLGARDGCRQARESSADDRDLTHRRLP
jgi:hypothetical protein